MARHVDAPSRQRCRLSGSLGLLDDVGKRIVELLQERRPSVLCLGRHRVGLSEAAVRQRVQKLIEAGVMEIVAVTDPLQLGFRRQAMVGLRVVGDLSGAAEANGDGRGDLYVVTTAGSLRHPRRGRLRGRRRAARPAQPPDPGPARVHHTETFVYLKLNKQHYNWGTR